MKKLLAVLCMMLVPSVASSGGEMDVEHIAPSAAHRDSALPDIFFDFAHTCQSAAADCLPDNLVSNPFSAYIKVFVPSTQSYTRHYIVTDIQGAMVGYGTATSTLTGTNHLSFSFSLTSGKLYRFIAIVVGADGETAVSDPYTFKVVS